MGIRKQFFGFIIRVRKLRRIPVVLKTNGFIHSVRLTYMCFILPTIMKFLPIYLELYKRVKALKQKYLMDKELRHLQAAKEELLKLGENGYRLKIEDLGLNQEKLKLLKEMEERSQEVGIAEIDQDGFLLSHFGPIRNAPTISKKQFFVRKRFNLKIVAINGYVGVKKDYLGNKLSFLSEIKALHSLGIAGCNVPAILEVDFDNLTLTFSYILGPVLREELAKRGALLRDRNVDNNPNYMSLDPKQRWLKRIEEGKRVLYGVIDTGFVEMLFAELNKVHESRFILNDIKYGNIIIEKRSGKPYLIDFDFARDYSKLQKNWFRILRDQDIENFNLHFNSEKLTYRSIKERIRDKNIPAINDCYAPVYFGAGLRIGGPLWDADTGYGRWHFILKNNLPSLSGKRILDLGTNNAFNSIQMLRHGAREVIGIESESKYIGQGNFVKAAFEWADNTRYNFKYIQADMKALPTMNLGEFDMVIALCSLYYLDDDSIFNLIRHISTITDIFVLECNMEKNMNRKHSYTYRKASVEYAVKSLRCNGFTVARVIAPPKYSRPLVIGRKEK